MILALTAPCWPRRPAVNDPPEEDTTFSDASRCGSRRCRRPGRSRPSATSACRLPRPRGVRSRGRGVGSRLRAHAAKRTNGAPSRPDHLPPGAPSGAGRAARPARAWASRERWLERCDYWVAIEERIDPGTLAAAIGAQLAPLSPSRWRRSSASGTSAPFPAPSELVSSCRGRPSPCHPVAAAAGQQSGVGVAAE